MRGFQQNGVCLKDRIEDKCRSAGMGTYDRPMQQGQKITLAGLTGTRLERNSCLITNRFERSVGLWLVSARNFMPEWEHTKGRRLLTMTQQPSYSGASQSFVLIGYDDRAFLITKL